jgi:hypothetical protein
MAKPASELTLAIRSLCEESGGTITHAQARPKLKKLGLKIVRDPGRQSANLTSWLEYDVDYDDADSIQSTADACGFDAEVTKAVLKEHGQRVAFKKERNNFDVTKNIWKKALASGKPSASRKPSGGKNQRAVAASAPEPARPRGKGRTVAAPAVLQTGEEMEALQFVEANGGMAAVETMLTEARQTVTDLESVVSTVEALTKRITAAA